jgi:hypothetical protein
MLLEASLLRSAVPQKDGAAIKADKVDVFEWEPRGHDAAFGEGQRECRSHTRRSCDAAASKVRTQGVRWESSRNGQVSHHGDEIEILGESIRTPIHLVFRCHRLT